MSDPDALRSVFEDPSDLEMDNLTKAQSHPQIEMVDLITPVYSTWAVPHHSTTHWSYSYGTHCGFRAYCTYIQWYSHCSHYSYQPTISSTSMTPKTISLVRGHHGSREGNALYQVEDQDDNHYLDHLPYGQHRSRILNSSRPRSCDRS